MDPDATLKEIIDAAVAGNVDEFYAAAIVLFDWLLAGGFAPADPRADR